MTSHTDTRHGASGFTLLEMLVVVAVMGLILAMVAGFGPPHSGWLETRAAAQRVAEAMQNARGRAIASGRPVAFVLPHLPGWLHVSVKAGSSGIVFEPDGSALGGRVRLDDKGRAITIAADWLTGRVSVDAH